MADNTKIPVSPTLLAYHDFPLPPVTALWLIGTPSIIFNSARSLEELYVTKNAYYTKHENERLYSAPLLNKNMITMDTDDPQYKSKRKVLSSAFFKNKIRAMMHIVKSTSLKIFKDIQD